MSRKLPKWTHPYAAERDYTKALVALAEDIERGVKQFVYPVLGDLHQDAVEDEPVSSGWVERLRLAFVTTSRNFDLSAPIARMHFSLRQANRYNKRQFHRILQAAYGVDVFKEEPWLAETLSQWEAQNIKLIKSIPTQALDRMHGRITAAVRKGTTAKHLRGILQDEFGITRRRAKLIADDQIGKLNGQLTRQRQTGIGVESYHWHGVLDRRERDKHVAREGVRFKWDNPPSDGNPGEPVRCRCWSSPVLPLLEDLPKSGATISPLPERGYSQTVRGL